MAEPRTIKVSAIARVEGEGALNVVVRDGQVVTAELNIYEPPRFFEAFLRGREVRRGDRHRGPYLRHLPRRVPDERAHAGWRKHSASRCRQGFANCDDLLYCGEWIESHGLHVYMLHAPDFLGFDNGIALAAKHRDVVEPLLANEEDRQPHSGCARRPGHSPD
ncbi:MAG: hypothetical protein U0792_10520 [Gemmataceae bacterium]